MFSQLESLSPGGWIVAAIAMVLVGVSRTGFRGAALFAIPVFAAALGAKISTGVVLIMYLSADLMAIGRFAKTVDWKIVLRLAPWAALGVIAGTVFGSAINDRMFALVIGIVVLLTLAVSLAREFRDNPVNISGKKWLAAPLGVAGGFSSMVGNAAGPLMNMYMLALGLDKRRFLSNLAWFFFFLNTFKVPFHVFVWKTITVPSLAINLIALVPIFVGTIIGGWLSNRVSEKVFRYISFGLAGAGAIRLLLG